MISRFLVKNIKSIFGLIFKKNLFNVKNFKVLIITDHLEYLKFKRKINAPKLKNFMCLMVFIRLDAVFQRNAEISFRIDTLHVLRCMILWICLFVWQILSLLWKHHLWIKTKLLIKDFILKGIMWAIYLKTIVIVVIVNYCMQNSQFGKAHIYNYCL